jgi:ubiquinol-cytochrome c reductase cytochrome c1 subunit
MRCLSLFLSTLLLMSNVVAATALVHIDPLDKAQVNRGAHLFMDYCSGCHAIKYMRYSSMLVEFKLIQFSNSPAEISMPARDATQWFGQVPPDLSLIAKTRGSRWLYQYLMSFYPDIHQPFGENNRLLPNVMMPNPLSAEGKMQSDMVVDIVTFLAYVSDPSITIRHQIGPFVLLICLLLFILVYYLQRLYWKKINSSNQ